MFWQQHRAGTAGLLTWRQMIAVTKAGMRKETDSAIREVPGVEATGPGYLSVVEDEKQTRKSGFLPLG